MQFLIADTFTSSLARLTRDEQKVAKTTAFDLQLDPAHPSHQFHRLDRSRDKNFWSVRVSSDIRLIVHKTVQSLLLCYVDHHDKAYVWAERRKLETHPRTGAAQFVEVVESVLQVAPGQRPLATARRPVDGPKREPLSKVTEDELLSWGVPAEWLASVQGADEDALLEIASHLPAEAAEALLQAATGAVPTPPSVDTGPGRVDPFAHPDAQRRFRVIADSEELERALAYPWERWITFLHPSQRQWVQRDFNGPARISGSAGTGKTIVALHRAVHLASQDETGRVLLATLSAPLASALRAKLRRLIGDRPRLAERIDVDSLDALADRLFRARFGTVHIASSEEVRSAAEKALQDHQSPRLKSLGLDFVVQEWHTVVDAWQVDALEAYRDMQRLGRRRRLNAGQRDELWSVFSSMRATLEARGLATASSTLRRVTEATRAEGKRLYDHVVVDEAQDVSVSQLRLLAALTSENGVSRPNGLFLAGDVGQQIFQHPFSWKSLGIDIRGRSHTLHVNYRTSEQIRRQADMLLGPEVSDADGNTEARRGTVSVLKGPPPVIDVFATPEDEANAVGEWLRDHARQGLQADECAVFVRSDRQIERARDSVSRAGLKSVVLDERLDGPAGHVCVSTMHLAKGLEFRAVVVMACDEDVIPLQERIAQVGDEADLEAAYNAERHLLYVACTRARDSLMVTGVEPPSEFLTDLAAPLSARK